MWREEDDEDRAEMLNALDEFDYDQMRKAQHDYEKYHDIGFFGTAIEDWSFFDRDALTPMPRTPVPHSARRQRRDRRPPGGRLPGALCGW
jgi:hypothetical protein